MWRCASLVVMAGSGTPQPPQPPTRPQAQSPRPAPPAPVRPAAAAQAPVRKPPQVLAINRREEQDRLEREAAEARAAAEALGNDVSAGEALGNDDAAAAAAVEDLA